MQKIENYLFLSIIYHYFQINFIFFHNRANNGGRKSIKLSEFEESAFELSFNYKIRLDYLNIIKNNESEF